MYDVLCQEMLELSYPTNFLRSIAFRLAEINKKKGVKTYNHTKLLKTQNLFLFETFAVLIVKYTGELHASLLVEKKWLLIFHYKHLQKSVNYLIYTGVQTLKTKLIN